MYCRFISFSLILNTNSTLPSSNNKSVHFVPHNSHTATLAHHICSAGLSLSETHLLVNSNTAAELYDLTISPPQLSLSMTGSQVPAPLLQGQFLFRAEGGCIEICSTAGALEQTLTLSEVELLPTCCRVSWVLGVVTPSAKPCAGDSSHHVSWFCLLLIRSVPCWMTLARLENLLPPV